ncbi:MAG: choice-of-anchor D domain-containing protein, partial [Bdellovibrionales bacterium]|nr:choice-of-anchor D domain-containing protein [Bdellovibrionales bacterium]
MMRFLRLIIVSALVFGTGLTACSRQDSVFAVGAPAKPPTTVSTSTQEKFSVTDTGSSSTSLIALRVSGGHLPQVISAQIDPPFRWAGSNTFPGVGGTCDINGLLDQCLIAVEFNPSAPGDYSKSVRVVYEGRPGSHYTWSTPLKANTPAVLALQNGASSFDLGTFYFGQPPVAKPLSIQHVNGGPASDFQLETGPASILYEGNGNFPGTTGTCGATLSSGSCLLSLYLTGISSGNISQPLTLSYFDGKQRQSLTIQATGAVRNPPVLGLLPATQSIGNVFLGGSGEIPLTVEYQSGDVPAIGLGMLGITGDLSGGIFSGIGTTCGQSISPPTSPSNRTCTLQLTITPTVKGPQTRTLTLLYRSGNAWIEKTAQVSFNVVEPASLSVSPSNLSFPVTRVGSTSSLTLTLNHASGFPTASGISATFPAGFRYQNGTFPGTGGNCSTSLSPGGSCTIAVEFAPTSPGSYSGEVTINFQSGLTATQQKVHVTGKTQAKLALTVGSATPPGPILVGLNSTT